MRGVYCVYGSLVRMAGRNNSARAQSTQAGLQRERNSYVLKRITLCTHCHSTMGLLVTQYHRPELDIPNPHAYENG